MGTPKKRRPVDKAWNTFKQLFILIAIVVAAFILWISLIGIMKPSWDHAVVITVGVGGLMAISEIIFGIVFNAQNKNPEKSLREIICGWWSIKREYALNKEAAKQKQDEYRDEADQRAKKAAEEAEKAEQAAKRSLKAFNETFSDFEREIKKNKDYYSIELDRNRKDKRIALVFSIVLYLIFILVGLGSLALLIWSYETRSNEDVQILANSLTSVGGLFIAGFGMIITNKDSTALKQYNAWIDIDRKDMDFYTNLTSLLACIPCLETLKEKRNALSLAVAQLKQRITDS
jgi:cation transport ATPase